jgi:hypothetical protein
MGIRGTIAKSTLADANEARDWRLYLDFAQTLIATARKLYAGEEVGVEIDSTVYALDSTSIDHRPGPLALFPWARFQKTKAPVKLHTLMNMRRHPRVHFLHWIECRTETGSCPRQYFEAMQFHSVQRARRLAGPA